MTAESVKLTILDQIERHGFSTVLCVVLLSVMGYYANQLVEDGRVKGERIIEMTRSTTEAVTESASATRQMIDQSKRVEGALEDHTEALDRLIQRLEP